MTDKKTKNDHPDVDSQQEAQNQESVTSELNENSDLKKERGENKSHKEQQKLKKDKNQEKIAELEEVIEGMKDKHLRLQAEFDNFRKRTLKEKAELIKSGGEKVLSGVLPVIDDFERALATMENVPDDDPAKIGFVLIFNKFKDFMKQNNMKEIDATGAVFDVDLHFALTKIPAPSEDMKGKVVDVIEKGYLLNDKVLRYARVVVGE